MNYNTQDLCDEFNIEHSVLYNFIVNHFDFLQTNFGKINKLKDNRLEINSSHFIFFLAYSNNPKIETLSFNDVGNKSKSKGTLSKIINNMAQISEKVEFMRHHFDSFNEKIRMLK